MKLWRPAKAALLIVCIFAVAGCNSGSNTAPPLTFSPEVQAMHKLYSEVIKREVIEETVIDIQYLIISHRSDGHLGKRKRISLAQAEQKAAELLKQAQGGADFELMVLTESYRGFEIGELAGHVRLVTNNVEQMANPESRLRSEFSIDFQKTVYRLQPGEVCVVPYHNKRAPFGHYLVRRLPTGLLDGLVDSVNLSDTEKAMYALATGVLKRKEIKDNQVTVQHVLIGHAMIRDDKKYLTRRAARKLAAEVLKRAQNGEDFEALVKKYSYDYNEENPTGEYKLYQEDSSGAIESPTGTARDKMVKHFGDVSYKLKVGEIGVCVKSIGNSPHGFHIIKRVK